MPNATHLRLQATAKRLIEKHGRNVIFVRFDESGDEIEPTLTPVDLPPVKAVQTKLTGKEDAELQAQTDIVFLVHGLVDTAPDDTMRLRDSRDGIDYSIKDIAIVAPGETSMLYRVYGAV